MVLGHWIPGTLFLGTLVLLGHKFPSPIPAGPPELQEQPGLCPVAQHLFVVVLGLWLAWVWDCWLGEGGRSLWRRGSPFDYLPLPTGHVAG